MQLKGMAVLVTPQLLLPVEAAALAPTQMGESAEVHLEGLLAPNRVLLPLAAVRLLEVLVESLPLRMAVTAFILLAVKVGLLVVHIQDLEQAVATSVVEAAVMGAAHTYREQQAGLDILIPL